MAGGRSDSWVSRDPWNPSFWQDEEIEQLSREEEDFARLSSEAEKLELSPSLLAKFRDEKQLENYVPMLVPTIRSPTISVFGAMTPRAVPGPTPEVINTSTSTPLVAPAEDINGYRQWQNHEPYHTAPQGRRTVVLARPPKKKKTKLRLRNSDDVTSFRTWQKAVGDLPKPNKLVGGVKAMIMARKLMITKPTSPTSKDQVVHSANNASLKISKRFSMGSSSSPTHISTPPISINTPMCTPETTVRSSTSGSGAGAVTLHENLHESLQYPGDPTTLNPLELANSRCSSRSNSTCSGTSNSSRRSLGPPRLSTMVHMEGGSVVGAGGGHGGMGGSFLPSIAVPGSSKCDTLASVSLIPSRPTGPSSPRGGTEEISGAELASPKNVPSPRRMFFKQRTAATDTTKDAVMTSISPHVEPESAYSAPTKPSEGKPSAFSSARRFFSRNDS